MRTPESLIAQRKQWLFDNKIADWSEVDTVWVTIEYAAQFILEDPESGLADRVIIQFNELFQRSVSLTTYRKRVILARINEGKKLKPKITFEQFRVVFEYKKREWENTDMDKFLEIETLCAGKHFFKYLDQARANKEFIHYYQKKYGLTQSKAGGGVDPQPTAAPLPSD